MKDNKNKNKIIGISIGILIVLLVVISSTYAYWQITRSQKDPNSIIAACLDFNVDFPVGINQDNAWPISDSEGLSLDGYTFTVTNNCDTDVNYVIGLESVTSDGISEYLSDSSISLAFDNEHLGTYSDLTNLQGPSTDARGSKELRTATLKGNSENTHNLKLWIDEESDVSEQGRGFAAKLFITGGQGIEPVVITTPDTCFEITEGGEIIGYDESCGESVVLPATVNNIAVKSIDTNAFKETQTTYHYNFMLVIPTSTYQIEKGIVVNPNEEENLRNWAATNGYAQLPLESYTSDFSVPEGSIIQYCNILNGQPDCYNKSSVVESELFTTYERVSITGLDLSKATNLEVVESRAFSNATQSTDADNINDVPYSLTSLTFGNNDNEIRFEYGAFARINVDELTLYTSYDVGSGYSNGLVAAKVNNLTIKPTNDKTIIDTYILNWIEANNLYIAEGITSIKEPGDYNIHDSQFSEAIIGKLVLPTTLSIKNLSGEILGQNFVNEANANQARNVIEELIINTPITSIEHFTLAKIKKIQFPDTLETIKGSTFSSSSLQEINLPKNLKTIEDAAFRDSVALAGKLTIPASLEEIGHSAFINTKISSIEIENTSEKPSVLKTIGASAFGDTSQLTGAIEIPSSVTTIGSAAFANTGLTSLSFENTAARPAQLEVISRELFHLGALTSIHIPQSVKVIDESAFHFNHDLEEVIIEDTTEKPSQLTTIGPYAFYDTHISNITVPKSVNNIGSNAFHYARKDGEAYDYKPTIVLKGRTSTEGMTLGEYWNGGAQIHYP